MRNSVEAEDRTVTLTAAERDLILEWSRRSLDNTEYALMHIHPAHPRRGVVTLERQIIEALIAKLER
jgi:hypothetical protein